MDSTADRPRGRLAATRTFHAPAGTVIAVRDGEVVRARGIRYATAGRFALPVRITPSGTPLHAAEPAPAAPQLSSALLSWLIAGGDRGIVQDEDCLRLSITLPAGVGPGERLPVMVFVHGGSYVSGAGDLAVYDPAMLVAEQRVIVVAVTYRLGVLGFLGDGTRIPANLGLLDLIEALRWVQENIGAFGGDAERVTAFGQSSGGDAIAHLMIAEGAEGLFRRAIIQSAPLGIVRGRRRMTAAMLTAAGELRSDVPLQEVLLRQRAAEHAAKAFGVIGGMPFGVQYGHAPLPPERRAAEAWRRAAPGIDVLIGCTREETGLIIALAPRLGRLFRARGIGGGLQRAAVALSTRRIYAGPARSFAARHRRAGGRALDYRMGFTPLGGEFGAAHITDLPLLLGTREAWEGTELIGSTPWSLTVRRGRAVRRAWAEFASSGEIGVETEREARGTLELAR